MEQQTNPKLTKITIDEKTSRVISAIRIILAMFILLCHNTTHFENSSLVFNALQSFVQTGPLTSCALPLFFVISGYLHFSKSFEYAPMIRKKIRTILLPYFIVCFFISSISQIKNLINYNGTTSVFIPWIFDFPCDRLFTFAVAEQLWFLRILFFMFVVSPILKKLLEKLPALYFCTAYLLLNSGLNIFGLSIPTCYELGHGLLYFGFGAFFAMKGLTVKNLDSFRTGDIFSVMILVSSIFLASLLFPNTILLGLSFRQMASSMVILTTVSSSIILIKIVSLAVKYEKVYGIMKNLSEYSMWIFLFHYTIPHWIVELLLKPRIPLAKDSMMAVYLLLKLILVSAITLLSGIACRKICPPLFVLLSGRRSENNNHNAKKSKQ